MEPLHKKHCVPCEGGVSAMSEDESFKYLNKVSGWHINNFKSVEKTLTFVNFTKAIDFINKVAKIAEAENHHPDISLFSWNKVKLTLSTHAIGGLSENDFILASKIDQILKT